MKKTNVITPMWLKCQEILKTGDLELADNKLMEFVWKLADYTMNGFKDADKIEGVKQIVIIGNDAENYMQTLQQHYFQIEIGK